MRNQLEKHIFIVLLCTTIYSCTSKDPFSEKPFGNLSTEEFYNIYLKKELIIETITGDGYHDTIYTYNINGDSTLRSILWTNTDEYSFDSIYSVKLNLGSDSTLFFGKMDYNPGKGEINKEKLTSIMQLYKEWYGEPSYEFTHSISIEKIHKVDSLFKFIETQNAKTLNKKKSKLQEEIDNAKIIYQNGIIHYNVWKLNKNNLMISYSMNDLDSSYKNSFIKYESKDYKTITEKRKEFIRQTAEMNDFIKIDINLDPFTKGDSEFTNRINLTISSISHNLPEEPRNIRNFKFDVMIKNEYLDTLLIIEGLEYDGIGILESAYHTGVSSSPGGLLRYYVDYNPSSDNGKKYEKLRNIRDRKIENRNFDDIKVSYNIKSIVFQNGDVKNSISSKR